MNSFMMLNGELKCLLLIENAIESHIDAKGEYEGVVVNEITGKAGGWGSEC